MREESGTPVEEETEGLEYPLLSKEDAKDAAESTPHAAMVAMSMVDAKIAGVSTEDASEVDDVDIKLDDDEAR